jgi:hypothetical protein
MGAVDTLPVFDQLESIYVSYFGRAADATGLAFWEGQYAAGIAHGQSAGQVLINIANAFVPQAETLALFPFLATPVGQLTDAQLTTYIDSVYQNLFNRTPPAHDPGVAYWLGQIKSGAISFGAANLAIANGAIGVDATTLHDKINAADHFTQVTGQAGLGTAPLSNAFFQEAHAVVKFTDATAESVTEANAGSDAFAANGGTVFVGPGATFTLTVGQDTITGFGHDTFNAPLAGVFGNQNTLTDFDKLIEISPNTGAVLNASLDGHTNINGVTIQGISTYNFVNDGHGTVTINGGPPTPSAPTPTITGVNTVNYNDNGGGASLLLGTPLLPIDVAGDAANGFTIGIANALGGQGHWVDIALAAAVLTGTETVTVNAFSVGNASDTDLGNAYGVAIGGTGPHANGFLNWILNSTGATLGAVNDIALGAEGNNTATTLTITDDGSTTIVYASAASGSTLNDWTHLTTIDASGTSGNLTITGGETDPGFNGGGLLAGQNSDGNSAFTTFIGGSGTYLLDLSAWDGNPNNLNIDGGFGDGVTVELSNEEVFDFTAAPAGWFNVPTLDIVDTGGGIGEAGAILNMNFLPGTTTLNFLNEDSQGNNPDPNQVAFIDIINGPNTFTVNFNGTDQRGFGFEVTGVGGANSTLTVTYQELDHSTGAFESAFYNTVNIDINTNGDNGPPTAPVDLYQSGLTFVANGDGSSETVNINGDVGATGVPLDIEVGKEDVAFADVGHSSITLLGGTILDPTTGTLNINGHDAVELGVTNAHVIVDTSTTGAFDMATDSNVTFNDHAAGSGVNVTADAAGSTLQGSLGVLTGDVTGWTGDDTLTDFSGGSDFFGAGGSDTINLVDATGAGGGGNTVHFGEFQINGPGDFDTAVTQLITDHSDNAYEGFWGVANGAAGNPTPITFNSNEDKTTINGFNGGATADTLEFNVNAWAFSVGGKGSLVDGAGAGIVNGAAHEQLVSFPGATVLGPTNVVLYNIDGGLVGAGGLVAALQSSGVGDLKLAGPITAGEHMLFAYSAVGGGVNIADVDFVNGVGAGGTAAAGTIIHASDIVHVDDINLIGLGSHPADIQFVHV